MAKKRVDKRGTRKPITKIKFLVEGITEKFYFKELLKFKEYSVPVNMKCKKKIKVNANF